MGSICVALITYKSPVTAEEFAEYFSFRWQMLRKPLNLPRGSEQDQLEKQAFHVAAYHDRAIVGLGRVHTEADGAARIRYMAVHEKYQNRGVGSTILDKLEEIVRAHKLQICWLYAREGAVGFYVKNGYAVKDAGNSERPEIRHWRMEKYLV